MTKLGSILFIENVPEAVNTLNKWLGGKVTQERKNDAGELTFAMYLFDEIMIGLLKPSEDTTNTSSKVNGSTNNMTLLVDRKEEVNELFKKAIAAGLTEKKAPSHMEEGNETSPYACSLQDTEKQYWSVFFYSPEVV